MEERRRIARDLHDSFIQALAAIGLRLDALGASARPSTVAQLRGDLAQLREIVGREQKRVCDYVTEMREPLDANSGLPQVIEQAVDAFGGRTQVPVEVTLSAGVSDLPREIVRELMPLHREAFANIEKHAFATHVAVMARVNAGEFTLTIQDDGIGIGARDRTSPPATSAPPGHGLFSMRERAHLLGGTFSIASAEGTGTTLTISVPLPALSQPGLR